MWIEMEISRVKGGNIDLDEQEILGNLKEGVWISSET
jgi:hypothetical protein